MCTSNRIVISTERSVVERSAVAFLSFSRRRLVPETTVEGAVLNCLRNMAHGNAGLCVPGPAIVRGDLQYAVVGACAQTLLLHGPFQQTFRFRGKLAVSFGSGGYAFAHW